MTTPAPTSAVRRRLGALVAALALGGALAVLPTTPATADAGRPATVAEATATAAGAGPATTAAGAGPATTAGTGDYVADPFRASVGDPYGTSTVCRSMESTGGQCTSAAPPGAVMPSGIDFP
ncbi:hypothetical protein KSP35_11855 [Aquihabitans sp. G128]|uniref:hypothetical protein n=1 Tax=Aquihabitans sp. G128 TaxID=2849779 RepID=UPI001C24C333|nr:hypothetical protein [Aquihabitans sp. G128]QXC59109.1 hypothetical protein KSP35_11855 [Aquihabitans sp. G128]